MKWMALQTSRRKACFKRACKLDCLLLCHLQLQTIQHHCLAHSSCQHLQHGTCPETKSVHHQACPHYRGQRFGLRQDCLRHQVCSWQSCSVHTLKPLSCLRVNQEVLYHSMLVLAVYFRGVLRPPPHLRHIMLLPCSLSRALQSQRGRHVILLRYLRHPSTLLHLWPPLLILRQQ